MTLALAGKVALVTGGSRGIGAAIVQRLARDGARVAFNYFASADQALGLVARLELDGLSATAWKADQADPLQVQQFVRAASERLGAIDIVVNSAGIFSGGVIGDPSSDIAALERQTAINVGGVVATVRAAVPLMNDGGRIISIGTVAVAHTAFPGIADYAATKAAVAAYTRGWARDLGSRRITVNVIQPGAIETDLNRDEGPSAATLKGMTALGRYGRPEEIAGAVAFLAGPDASYITGTTLNIDGGRLA